MSHATSSAPLLESLIIPSSEMLPRGSSCERIVPPLERPFPGQPTTLSLDDGGKAIKNNWLSASSFRTNSNLGFKVRNPFELSISTRPLNIPFAPSNVSNGIPSPKSIRSSCKTISPLFARTGYGKIEASIFALRIRILPVTTASVVEFSGRVIFNVSASLPPGVKDP